MSRPLNTTLCPVPQAFLRGIVSHPVLRDSEALKLFLLQPGELSYNPAWIALLHSIGSECSPFARRATAAAIPPSLHAASGRPAAATLTSLHATHRM